MRGAWHTMSLVVWYICTTIHIIVVLLMLFPLVPPLVFSQVPCRHQWKWCCSSLWLMEQIEAWPIPLQYYYERNAAAMVAFCCLFLSHCLLLHFARLGLCISSRVMMLWSQFYAGPVILDCCWTDRQQMIHLHPLYWVYMQDCGCVYFQWIMMGMQSKVLGYIQYSQQGQEMTWWYSWNLFQFVIHTTKDDAFPCPIDGMKPVFVSEALCSWVCVLMLLWLMMCGFESGK